MLLHLYQHQSHVILPILFSFRNLEILDSQAATAVCRRYDAPVERDGVTLFLNFFLQVSEVLLDDLVCLTINIAMRLQQGDFLLQPGNLVFEIFDLSNERLLIGNGVDDIVLGLNTPEFEYQVAAGDHRHRYRDALKPSAAAAA